MKYQTWWRNKYLTANATTIDEMIFGLEFAVKELKAMRDDGIELADGAEEDYARLVTTDPLVAKKYEKQYGFEEEDVEVEEEDEEEDELD